MPDADDTLDVPAMAFATAKTVVAARLADLAASSDVLQQEELRAYAGRGIAAGWRMPVEFSDGVRRIDLLLPAGFPWQPPRVALIDRPPFLSWPHIEHDGVLCLAPDMLDVDPYDPAGVVTYMLGDAAKLIDRLIAGELITDFQDEFLSYWDHAADEGGPHFVSLLTAEPPTREVRVWRGKKFYILAETDAELERWLVNRFGKKPDGFKTDTAALLWLEAPPIPSDYPRSGQDLRRLAAAAGDDPGALLAKFVCRRPDRIIAALGFTTANGPALAGVIVPEPSAPRYGARDPLFKGFRPGTIPDSLLLARYLGNTNLIRRSIERADPDWIHGRGQDSRTAQLREKTVAVIGCGSVGAAIAVTLAQAGVGRLALIDFDILKWSNIGRHVLGATYVGQPKSKALAEKLRSDFPHLYVTDFVCDADTAVRRHADVLASCDLVVSATGSWTADSRLDAWQETTARCVPIVYGWLEAHACAGHALLIGDAEGSLRHGFDRTGLPHFQVTVWPNGTPLRREPACGAAYQPYGSMELGFINSLIAELALDALLGATEPTHRIWVGPRKRLVQIGGGWSAVWREDSSFREEGGFILERPWPVADDSGKEAQAA